MKLEAIKTTYQGGKLVGPGDQFETTDSHARELVKKGYAREYVKPEPKPKAEKPKTDK